MRLPDGRNVATRQAVHGSAPCARTEVTGRWLGKQQILLALMIPLMMIVDDVLPKRMTERLLAEQDELRETFLFD